MEKNDIVAAPTSTTYTKGQYATSDAFLNDKDLCKHAVLEDNLQHYLQFFAVGEFKLYSQMTISEKADFLQEAKKIYEISSSNSNAGILQLISEYRHEQAWIAFLSSINDNIKIALEQDARTKNDAKKTSKQNQKYIEQLIKDNDKRWDDIEIYQEKQESSDSDYSSSSIQRKGFSQQTSKIYMKKQDFKTNSEANDYSHVKSGATNFNSTSSSLSSFREVVLQPASDEVIGKEILIPADGNCLYTSVFLGFLLPAINNEVEFGLRLGVLIGENLNNYADLLKTLKLGNNILNVDFLRSDYFKQLIIFFRKHMGLDNGLWGGLEDIKILAEKLNIEIQEYTLNPDDINEAPIKSDLIKPQSKQSVCIINVLRAKANDQEVATDGEDSRTSAAIRDSASSGHAQHFRLIVTKEVFDNYLKTSESFSKQQNSMVKSTDKFVGVSHKSNSNTIGPTIASSNNDNKQLTLDDKTMLRMQNTDNKNEELKKLEEVVDALLAKTQDYIHSNKEPDKRILLETYGFALALSYHIADATVKEKIEKKIIESLKNFAFEDLRVVKDIELSNLAGNRQSFKAAFENIRLKFAANKGASLRQSLEVVDESFKKTIRAIFNYLHGMLGGPPTGSRHSAVCVGSLATQMTTPYSDIEYIILIDKHTDANMVYFTNFADLFELLLISLGESPIYKAEQFLEEFKPYFKYIKNGTRVDEHKKPQDINRLYGLINTPQELLEKVATKRIHEPGNHTTSALLTTGFLDGDYKLYTEFTELFEKLLPTSEYLECLRKLIEEDIRASSGVQDNIENSFLSKEDKDIEVKSILIQPLHLARQLAIFLRSAGEELELKNNFFDVITKLKEKGYIESWQHQSWHDLVAMLLKLRLELQAESKSSKAIIKLKDLRQKINIDVLIKQLQEITEIVEKRLEERDLKKRPDLKHLRKIAEIIGNPASYGKQYQPPAINPNFVPRQELQNKIKEHFKNKDQQILTLTAHGMGGMGKTTLASFFFQHPLHHYTIRAWFNAGSREQIYQQYLDLIVEIEGQDKRPSKELPIEKQALMVKKWLEEKQDCLLVFDNVEKAEDLEGLLPEQGNHHILITSRSEIDWPINQSLDVDVMTIDESIDLIVKITGINKNNEENLSKLKILVNTLGWLPLALAQAGAYMKVRKKTIDDYLLDYKSSQASVLNVKTRMSPKHESIWVTFDMNFKALEEDCHFALQTLKQASWLAASNIQYDLLLSLIDAKKLVILKTPESSLLWGEIVENIGKYSLMRFDTERHLINIHPLLQDILRSKQTEEEQPETFIHMCRWLFTLINNKEPLDLDYRIFRPHAARLHQHCDHIANVGEKIGYENIEFLVEKIKADLERVSTRFYIKLDEIDGLDGTEMEIDFSSPISPRTLLWFMEEIRKSHPDHTIIEDPVFIPEEYGYIEPDTNDQVLVESATNNSDNHYNYLLREQDLPMNKIKLQKNAATAADLQAEIQENANEFRIPLEDPNITSGSKRIKIEESGIDPDTHAQANINSEDSKTSGYSSLSNSSDQETTAGAFPTINFSSSVQMQTINPLHSDDAHTGAAININQTGAPSISGGGIHYSFSSGCKNLTWAAQRATALVTKPLLYAYKNSSKIKQGFCQLAGATSREGIINGLQRAARARCSPDGTSRL
jgi:hypothetical protein